MPTVDKSIEVNAPLDRVYQLWTNFERFPEFMENVEEVSRKGPNMTHWRVKTGGQEVEWDARTLTEERKRVEWDAQGESRQKGAVTFDQLDANRTRVNVHIDYELQSRMKELGAKWFGVDDRVVQKDLERFKNIIEEGGTTGTTGTTGGPGNRNV